MKYTDTQHFCAPGASVRESMVKVNDKVTLKVFDFQPAEDKGRPVVVFVPGWISLMAGWGEVLREMTRDFPVKYIETRDKLSSQLQSGARLGAEDIGHDVVTLVKQWQLEEKQYIILGSSLGATAILDAARHFTPEPKAMILVAPNGEFRMPKLWQWVIAGFWPPFYFVIRPVLKWYLKHFRMQVDADRAQYDKYCMALDSADPIKLKAAAKAIWHYSVWDKLPHVNMPALLITASTDKLHEPQNTARMLKLLPRAEHLDMVTNGASHSAAMVEALRSYLDKLP